MPAKSLDSDDAAAFRDRVRAWVTSAVPQRWTRRASEPLSEHEADELRRDWSSALWEGGFAGIAWPVEFGGSGLGPVEEFIFFEECARAGAPDAVDVNGKYLAGPAIMAYGTDHQKERYLEPILRGTEFWCEGFSEPGAGSDLASASVRAEPAEGGFTITGQKTWTSYAHLADKCYLLAKSSKTKPRHHNLSLFLLDMKRPGVVISPIRQISGKLGFSDVFFDSAFVSESDLLGELNEGWHLAGLTGFRKLRHAREGLRRYVLIRQLADRYGGCLRTCAAAPRGNPDPATLLGQAELLKWHVHRICEGLAQGELADGPIYNMPGIASPTESRSARFRRSRTPSQTCTRNWSPRAARCHGAPGPRVTRTRDWPRPPLWACSNQSPNRRYRYTVAWRAPGSTACISTSGMCSHLPCSPGCDLAMMSAGRLGRA
jgi:hypothetical protein